MQIVYKFRVCFEEHEDVVRFIDIESTSSFEEFHKIIQSSIGFDASKDYIFYMSNDIWRTDQKICDSTDAHNEHLKSPGNIQLSKYINDPHQRFIYHFDPDLDWTFLIELVKIQKAEPGKNYPLLARKEGEAPKQYKLKGKQPGATPSNNEYDKMAELLMASRLMDELSKGDEDLEEDLEEDDDELDLDVPETAGEPAKPEVKAPAFKPVDIPVMPVDFTLDEEEFKVEEEDLDFFDSEEGESDEEKEEEDEDYFGSDNFDSYSGNDYDNDEY